MTLTAADLDRIEKLPLDNDGYVSVSSEDLDTLVEMARQVATIRETVWNEAIEVCIKHVGFLDLSDTDNEYVAFRLKELLKAQS